MPLTEKNFEREVPIDAEKFSATRRRLGLTQSELAQRLGTDRGGIASIEGKVVAWVRIKTIRKFSELVEKTYEAMVKELSPPKEMIAKHPRETIQMKLAKMLTGFAKRKDALEIIDLLDMDTVTALRKLLNEGTARGVTLRPSRSPARDG